MTRVFFALVCTLVACAAPQPGDPCVPGSPPIGTGVPRTPMLCTGPSGCDPIPQFRWEPVYRGGYARFCGCDGITHNNDIDYGGPATYPYRWYGSCEAGPCDSAYYDSIMGWFSHAYVSATVPPECQDCTRALLRDEECVGPDGLSMPMDCCRCEYAVLDESGVCTQRDYGFEMPAFCCE